MEKSKEQFFKEMKTALIDLLPEGVSVRFMTVDRPGCPGLHGCEFDKPGSTSRKLVFLEDVWDAYAEGATTDMIAKAIIGTAGREDHYEDYSWIRDKLFIRLVDAKKKEFLDTVPHRIIEDLAVVPMAFIEEDCERVGICRISNQLLEAWGVDADTVIDDAIKNAPNVLPLTVEPLPDGILTIKNERERYGAAGIFYDGALENIASAMGGSIFLLTLTPHEMFAVSDNGKDLEDLLEELKGLIAALPELRSDSLTDSVYHYGKDTGFRKVADTLSGPAAQ